MRKPVSSLEAPKAIGPYSQAIEAGARGSRLLFLSGQIPLDPATGELVPGGIEEQTRQVMENLKAVLDAAGLRFESVARTTIYLVALPRGARIEIDAIAVVE
jgi:2-iminobutanoate/2-iminopropanoate deaminase